MKMRPTFALAHRIGLICQQHTQRSVTEMLASPGQEGTESMESELFGAFDLGCMGSDPDSLGTSVIIMETQVVNYILFEGFKLLSRPLIHFFHT